MAEDQRSKLIFDALGDTHISLDDGLSILDAVRKDESPELTMEAIDKLLCRYPSSPLIFARKLEAGRSVEEQIKSIKSIVTESTKWSESEKFELIKKVWNIGTGYHRLRDFESAQKIWRQSVDLVMSLGDKAKTKGNILRARSIAFLEMNQMDEALRSLDAAKRTEQNIKNKLLEFRIQLKRNEMERVKTSFLDIVADSGFEPDLYAILQHEVSRYSTTSSMVHIEILETVFLNRERINRNLKDDVLSLKCLVNAIALYLDQIKGSDDGDRLSSKLKEYLKLSLSVIRSSDSENHRSDESGDRMRVSREYVTEIKWFAHRLWDLALEGSDADLYETTYDLLNLIRTEDRDAAIENTQKLCRLFGAVATISSLRTDDGESKRSAKEIVSQMDDTKDVISSNGKNSEFPMDLYVPITALVRLKCLLIVRDDEGVSDWVKTECPQIRGMSIVHFETALRFLLNFGSFADESRKYQTLVVLIELILEHIDIEKKEKEENVTLDVLCDYVRFVRLLISYQLKLKAFDVAECQQYFQHFKSVEHRIQNFSERNVTDDSSQGLMLGDEVQWFMSRSWNFGVSICSNRSNMDVDEGVSNLEAGKSWLEVAVKFSRHSISEQDKQGNEGQREEMVIQMESALDELDKVIERNKC